MSVKLAAPGRARRVFKPKILILYFALRDKRTPLYAKLPALFSLLYLFSPIDIIPDFIPVAGYIDDVVIVPLLLQLSVRLLPPQVKIDCMALVAKHAARLRIAAAVFVIIIAALAVWMFFIVKHLFS